MARDAPPGGDVLSRIAEMLGLEADLGATLESLQRQTRAQLVEWSQRLGLTGVTRLTKDALAQRLQQALEALGLGEARTGKSGEAGEPPDVARKFDLGRPAEHAVAPEHIPWSYGQDRVTAMPIDPDRLYAYWEVTDDAITRARAGLGPGGPEAWLNLRIYDVTGRLFDGTNAHGYFDLKVERGDRQWFFEVGKPGSTAVVEIGLKSFEGYFVRIARSGRVDFPRREPAPPGGVEWLTVHTASGEIAPPVEAPDVPPAAVAAPPPTLVPPAVADQPTLIPEERIAWGEAVQERREWEESIGTGWQRGERTVEWHGPAMQTTWEAGPFEVPVESSGLVEERHEGAVQVEVRNGRTRIVYGPWQVVIRGLGAYAERQVVATWELQRSWVTNGGGEPVGTHEPLVAGGGSGQPGASERRWPGASDLRRGGASEVWRLGGSEIRFLGASERLYGGASERAYGGASEQRIGGVSDAPLPYPREPRKG